MKMILIFSKWLFRYSIYACISLDLPDRRMPVKILMSGVPFSSMILSRYYALVIIFISSLAFKSRKFFISWNCFDVLIILSTNSICKRLISKTQNILFFESACYVKAIRRLPQAWLWQQSVCSATKWFSISSVQASPRMILISALVNFVIVRAPFLWPQFFGANVV